MCLAQRIVARAVVGLCVLLRYMWVVLSDVLTEYERKRFLYGWAYIYLKQRGKFA